MVVETWNSKTGKWFKCCPVCNSNFEGRKNQKYCGSICKNHHNKHPELAPVIKTSIRQSDQEVFSQLAPLLVTKKCMYDGTEFITGYGFPKTSKTNPKFIDGFASYSNYMTYANKNGLRNTVKKPIRKCKKCNNTGLVGCSPCEKCNVFIEKVVPEMKEIILKALTKRSPNITSGPCKTCNDTGVTRDNNRRPIYCFDCNKAIQIAGTGHLN